MPGLFDLSSKPDGMRGASNRVAEFNYSIFGGASELLFNFILAVTEEVFILKIIETNTH